MTDALSRLLADDRRRHGRAYRIATTCAAVAGGASVALLGVSGWFLAAAAGAGIAGRVAAQAFNVLLPSAAIRLLAIARTGTRYGERVFGHDAALRTLARVRPALFGAIAAGPIRRALSHGRGDAVTALVQDAGTLESWLVRRLSLAGPVAAVATGLALCCAAGWRPAVATALWLIAAIGVACVLRSCVAGTAATVHAANVALKDALGLLGPARVELRCHGLVDWADDHLDRLGAALDDAQRRLAARSAILECTQATMLGLAAASAVLLARDAGAPLAAMAALAAAMAVDGVAPVGRHLTQRPAVAAARRRLAAPFVHAIAAEDPIDNVGPRAVLTVNDPVTARWTPGARIALVGRSGCGKTRFVEGLVGLRGLPPRAVLVDGRDLGSLATSERRRLFAWLPQDAMLLSGTVRENLALAGDVDEVAMWRALDVAAIDDVIRALPAGIDTWIGEDGARLSGGERRRVALARTLLSDAPWLLLDEPTEGLDATTERHVLDGLAAHLACSGQGAIVVTHRPAVVRACDAVAHFGATENADRCALRRA